MDRLTATKYNPTRPKLLTVLCILSFVGCGMAVLVHAGLLVYGFISDSGLLPAFPESLGKFQSPAESARELVIELAALTGVILMWRLRKAGYVIYLLAESFLYFSFIYVALSLRGEAADYSRLAFEMLLPLPFDLAFFVLYATQLKHMSWSSPGKKLR